MPSSWRSRRRFVSNSAKTPEHVEEALAGCRIGIDRLFSCLQRRTARLDSPHDVLKVANGARQPVNSRDHQCVTLSRKNWSSVASSSRPSVLVPVIFSDRITVQPAAVRASSWMERS